MKKVLIKTQFHTIERIALSPNNSVFVVNGFSQDTSKKEVMKYEIIDLVKKKAIKQYKLSKKPKTICFNSSTSSSFSILLKDGLIVCSEKEVWRSASVTLPVGSTTKYLDMVDCDGICQFILSEDKKLLRIENEKEITDMYDLDGILEDTPTTITNYGEYLCIGCLNGFVYVSHINNPHDLHLQPLPPYFGLGASEECEIKEYPDTIVTKMNESILVSVYSDKTMVIFRRDTDLNCKIDHIIQNHAKAIYNIQMLPNECSDRSFSFMAGSADKTVRKWKVDINKSGLNSTQNRLGLL